MSIHSVFNINNISFWQQPNVVIIEETLVGLKLEAHDFWAEMREWLANETPWKKVKIGETEISREKIASFAELNLFLKPSLLGRMANEITDEALSELIHAKIDPIVRAVFLGDIELVKALLSEGAHSNLVIEGEASKSFNGYSLLDIAIFRNQSEIFDLLLAKDAAKPDGPKIRLPIDFLKQKTDMLKSLVQHGFLEALGRADLLGLGPLHWAAKKGNLDDICFWLNMGGRVDDLSSNTKITPLQIAVNAYQIEAASLLLEKGANPTIALKNALEGAPLPFLKLLMTYGANPHSTWSDNFSVLQGAVLGNRIAKFEILARAYKDVDKSHLIEVLTDFLGTKIAFLNEDRPNKTNTTHINREESIQWIRILIDVVDCKNIMIKGLPLLHCLAIYDENLALSVLKGGANPHVITSTGISALHVAAILNLQSLASTLIEMKVNLNVKDYTGATPLNHALNFYKTHALAVELIENETLPHANSFYLYNSFKLLGIKWLSPHLKRTPLLHAQWKEMNLGKLCSHLFDIGGRSDLLPLEAGATESISFLREGMISPRWLIKKIGESTKKMTSINPKLNQMISSLCEFSTDPTHTNKDYLTRIQEGKPVLIMTSTNCHSYDILIYKNAYVVCDGNFKTIEIKRFQRDLLTEEIIARLRYECSIADPEKAANDLRASVETLLQVRSESVDESLKSDTWVPQTIGNCNFKSFEMSIHALALLENEPVNHFLGSWILELKIQLASQYISNAKKGFFQPDQFLIQTMIADLEKHRKNSELETCNKIDAVCVSCHLLFDPVKCENGLLVQQVKNRAELCFSQFINVPLPEELYYRAILPK